MLLKAGVTRGLEPFNRAWACPRAQERRKHKRFSRKLSGVGHETFSYRAQKNGTVRIFWEGRCVKTLGGERGRDLASRLAEAGEEEAQELLQRATGNFKRGNERQKRRP